MKLNIKTIAIAGVVAFLLARYLANRTGGSYAGGASMQNTPTGGGSFAHTL